MLLSACVEIKIEERPTFPAITMKHLLVLLVCTVLIGCSSLQPPEPPKISSTSNLISHTSIDPARAKAHALAFNAILNLVNGRPLDHLGTDRVDQADIRKSEREALARQWNVKSKDELLGMLDWLRTTGHRTSYMKMHLVFASFFLEDDLFFAFQGFDGKGAFFQFEETEAKKFSFPAAKDLDDALSRLVVIYHLKDQPVVTGAVTYHLKDQPDVIGAGRLTTPIAAWDYGRYINLCQAGYGAGYLTEQEAWDLIMPMARLIQSKYQSWNQYSAEYVRGREFWSIMAMREDYDEVRRMVDGLFRPKGAWAEIPWGESLNEGPMVEDPYSPPKSPGLQLVPQLQKP